MLQLERLLFRVDKGLGGIVKLFRRRNHNFQHLPTPPGISPGRGRGQQAQQPEPQHQTQPAQCR